MRHKLKNIAIMVLPITSMMHLFITSVYAGPGNVEYRIPNPTRYNSVEDILNAAGTLIRPSFMLTFGGMVLYGGWVRLTSKGDADKIASSTQIIAAAGTGFGIAVLAPVIVNAVTGLLGVDNIVGIV